MMSPKPPASAAADGGAGASTSRSAQTARIPNNIPFLNRQISCMNLNKVNAFASSSYFGKLHEDMKPWRGRPLPNSQVVPTVINGGILALYFVLWGKGLLACGPLVALLAEYAGAVLGVLSAALYGRKVNVWRKANSFGSEPLENSAKTTGMKEMVVPITAGILSALRRVLARRVSLKNQLKRRLHAITIAAATCFLFPFAMWDTILGSASDSIVKLQFPSWAYLSSVLFGMVLIFYVDNFAEEKFVTCFNKFSSLPGRLHLVFSSPRHLMVTTGCIILLEISYKMDFSLLGFLLCSVILGFGIFEATSLERSKKSPLEAHELSNGAFHNQLPISALPS
ncbi:hypothetical protein PR202_ga10087 [Eleusine coracana subsp. coracana]|uniref:Uncharacterized protein n=1 Tax=Eleusine coracana subsp. coracana TaxID=191504 RepID=A0AAV5C5U1_ELECO|nr:hypothetical protein PR202_ga10087 [Eleusine coracana subsp. coracana]